MAKTHTIINFDPLNISRAIFFEILSTIPRKAFTFDLIKVYKPLKKSKLHCSMKLADLISLKSRFNEFAPARNFLININGFLND